MITCPRCGSTQITCGYIYNGPLPEPPATPGVLWGDCGDCLYCARITAFPGVTTAYIAAVHDSYAHLVDTTLYDVEHDL